MLAHLAFYKKKTSPGIWHLTVSLIICLICLGVYDKDAPHEVLISNPYLYRRGRLGKVYKTYSFWLTMLDALYQSTCIFFICQQVYHDTEVDVFEFGTAATTACMFVMLLHAAIEMRSWVSSNFQYIKEFFICFVQIMIHHFYPKIKLYLSSN